MFPAVTITALRGIVRAAGDEIALATDIRFASREAGRAGVVRGRVHRCALPVGTFRSAGSSGELPLSGQNEPRKFHRNAVLLLVAAI
jgi:hypothetical protein